MDDANNDEFKHHPFLVDTDTHVGELTDFTNSDSDEYAYLVDLNTNFTGLVRDANIA